MPSIGGWDLLYIVLLLILQIDTGKPISHTLWGYIYNETQGSSMDIEIDLWLQGGHRMCICLTKARSTWAMWESVWSWIANSTLQSMTFLTILSYGGRPRRMRSPRSTWCATSILHSGPPNALMCVLFRIIRSTLSHYQSKVRLIVIYTEGLMAHSNSPLCFRIDTWRQWELYLWNQGPSVCYQRHCHPLSPC